LTLDYLEEHVAVADWRPLEAAFDKLAAGRGLMYLGLHYASMEIAGRYAVLRTGKTMLTVMETVSDPAMQAWVVEQRLPIGLEIVDPADGPERIVAWARGGGLVGIVCDRPLVGAARPTELFGRTAMLPAGPAMVVLVTAIPTQVAVARRTGYGTYEIAHVDLEAPDPAQPMRTRVAAVLAAEARAIEALVAPAPEQWWTIMHPIWDDIR
jgi:lauroyl/myristoyl acyltransferase